MDKNSKRKRSMQQQESEQDREPSGEQKGYSFQEIGQYLLRILKEYPPARVFLLMLGTILLAAITQNGLLAPFLMIVVVGGIIFLARRYSVISTITRQTDDPVVEQDHLVEEQVMTLERLRALTPGKFEELVGMVMERLGYSQVKVVGGSYDLCVDITAFGSNGEQIAVQCKRYTSKNVSSDEMQKFIGMIYMHHRANKGMYFTTSSYTKDAQMLGKKNRIELIDGEQLVKIIRGLSYHDRYVISRFL
jgi:restriction system protein